MNNNIIFIFSDEQRWDRICIYVQKLDSASNLYKLSDEVRVFCNAFAFN